MRVEGMAALVAGGGSGLGAATAAMLAEAGARVAVLDRDGEAAARVAARWGGLDLACDVADAEGTARAVAEARERHGPARIAVNCAGVAPVGKILGRDRVMALDAFRRAVEVNLVGSFNVLRLAVAGMAELGKIL